MEDWIADAAASAAGGHFRIGIIVARASMELQAAPGAHAAGVYS